jgi:hypothetical protein
MLKLTPGSGATTNRHRRDTEPSSFARLRRADNKMKLFACNKINDLQAVSKKRGSAGSQRRP